MRDLRQQRRSPVHGVHGMVTTSQPLATAAGLEVLRTGGNAVDAAVAASAVLAVVQQTSTGLGGDCFIIYYQASTNRMVAFNGSGRAPAAASAQWYVDRRIRTVEVQTPHAVTIPGAVDAWATIVEDFGTKDLGELLQPAIAWAGDGFPVHFRMAHDWRRNVEFLSRDPATRRHFLAGGAPDMGARIRLPALAASLSQIALNGRDAFYKGDIAADLVSHLRELGGLHTLEDFAAAKGEYVTPISTNYHGYDALVCPPNGQGMVALEMLNILSGLERSDVDPLSPERLHVLIEATWLALADRDRFLCDPVWGEVPLERLLSAEHAGKMREAIRPDRAMHATGPSSFPQHRDTIYLAVVDRDGNAISFINSLFGGFGSGISGPKSGVLLHNRGCGFVLDPSHPNCIAPGKRPLHTLIPGMLVQNGRAVMPFGMTGGHFQAAGQAYLLGNMLHYGMDVQEAIDLPRVYPTQSGDNLVQAEIGIPGETMEALRGLGHNIERASATIGVAQAIWIDRESGVLTGGADQRHDGCALGF